jgi:hypothetical protein
MFFVRPPKQIGIRVGTDLPLEDETDRERERDEYEAKGCRERHHFDWRGNCSESSQVVLARLSHKGRMGVR